MSLLSLTEIAYGCQLINEVWFHSSCSRIRWSRWIPVAISLVSKCIFGIFLTVSHWFPAPWNKILYDREDQEEIPKIAPLRLSQKRYCILSRAAETSTAFKDFKVVPSAFTYTAPAKTISTPWWKTMGYHKLHQAVEPIIADVPDIVLFLEHINANSGTVCGC